MKRAFWDLPITFAVFALGVLILFFAFNEIRKRWKDSPKTETFWYLCGVCAHWAATVNSRVLASAEVFDWISRDMQRSLHPINVTLAFIGGVFYYRALTLHRSPNEWKWAVGIILACVFTVYFWELIR